MGLNLMKFVCVFLGAILGLAIATMLGDVLVDHEPNSIIPGPFGIVVVFALIGFMVATMAYRGLLKFNEWFLKLILQERFGRN